MRPIFTAVVFALLVCAGGVSLGTGCAAPSARTSACESACVNPDGESCRQCREREKEKQQEQRRRQPPPPSFPSGGGSPGGY